MINVIYDNKYGTTIICPIVLNYGTTIKPIYKNVQYFPTDVKCDSIIFYRYMQTLHGEIIEKKAMAEENDKTIPDEKNIYDTTINALNVQGGGRIRYYSSLTLNELKVKAKKKGVTISGLNKDDLIYALVKKKLLKKGLYWSSSQKLLK